jgi:hypothetical protein
LESLKGRDHSEDLIVDRRIIIKLILEEKVCRVWIVFMWLRIKNDGGIL